MSRNDHQQMNGSWFSINASHSDNTLGALFLGVISLVLLFALLRTQRRERDLLMTQLDES